MAASSTFSSGSSPVSREAFFGRDVMKKGDFCRSATTSSTDWVGGGVGPAIGVGSLNEAFLGFPIPWTPCLEPIVSVVSTLDVISLEVREGCGRGMLVS